MDKEPVGLVFIVNKTDGTDDIEEKLKPHFTEIVKNLIAEKLVTTIEQFDKILDGEFVHIVRLDPVDFVKLSQNDASAGGVARDVYIKYHDVEPNEDVSILHYSKKNAPWGFELFLVVLYSI